MLKILIYILTIIFIFAFIPGNSYAILDPFSSPNNKFGVHILFTSELEKARELVNTSGGDWGYVTIPIQAGDKDIDKWQKFMDDCARLHLIPIIRIATENYYFNTSVWKRPSESDILDFANFLNTLNWPVKNRYIIIFNEVNRGDEWEGLLNPAEYAYILSYASEAFKSRSEDFFIISAGLDNAAANVSDSSMNQFDFMLQMNDAVPGIFEKIDGLGSHSYPNPAFSQPPMRTTNMSISSFKFEKDLADRLSGKNLPIFITETGWSRKKVSDIQIGFYFSYAFEEVWNDPGIAAVTPFLLQAGGEPFWQFSLLNEHGGYNEISLAIQKIPKTKGEPVINFNTTISQNLSDKKESVPLKIFPVETQYDKPEEEKTEAIVSLLKWFLMLPI